VPPITPQHVDDILASHGAALVLYARQWCTDPDDALQEALIDLTQQTLAPSDPVAWLFTTTKRRAINQARGDSRRQRRHVQPARHCDAAAWFYSEQEKKEEIEKLQACIQQLDPLAREILVARIWGNLSFQQIADITEISSSSVHRHYQSSLAELRRLLDNGTPRNDQETLNRHTTPHTHS